MRTLFLTVAVLCGLLFIFHTAHTEASQESAEPEVVAEVNGVKVLLQDYLTLVKEKEKLKMGRFTADEKVQVLNEVINNTLMYMNALKEGVDKRPEVSRAIEKSKKEIILGTVISREVMGKITHTDDELKAFYEKNRDIYEPTLLSCGALSIEEKKEEGPKGREQAKGIADEIRMRLEKDEKAEDLAKEYSEKTGLLIRNRSFENKAKLQLAARDKELIDALFGLDEGRTAVLEYPGGFLITKVQRKFIVKAPFETVKNKVLTDFEFVQRQKLMKEYTDKLREGSDIKMNMDLIK